MKKQRQKHDGVNIISYHHMMPFITFLAKEVVCVLVALLCLSICLLAALLKILLTDCNEILLGAGVGL